MTDQPIDIKNDDPTNHNIHPLPKINQEWNESQPPKGDTKTKSFPREEVMIPVKCNVHPWMRAYIAVVHASVFRRDRRRRDVYNKEICPRGPTPWKRSHETYGTVDQQITVGANDSKTVDLTYKSDGLI